MALVTTKEMFQKAYRGGYAIGAFNFNNMETVQAITEACREEQAPVIIQVSQDVRANHAYMIKLAEAAAIECPDIPMALHLDHGDSFETCKSCIDGGFTSVMIDASKKDFEENIEITRDVAAYANKFGCSVEAELGRIGGREEEIVVDDASSALTDPERVPEFVEKTGVDALAVAIGTAHGFYKSTPKLDFERLRRIAELTSCPLVLHGGTGVSESDFQTCVSLGMSKINVGTEFKAAYTNAIRDAVAVNETAEVDPRNYMKYVKTKCEEIAEGKMRLFHSAGMA